MKLMKMMVMMAIGLGVLGLLGTIIVPSVLGGQAELVQLVKPADPDIAGLTGDIGTPVGKPELIIVSDQAAFLSGRSSDGAKLVDADYLKRTNQYPIQMKTVHFVASQIRIGFVLLLGMGVVVFVMMKRNVGPFHCEVPA